MDKKDSDKDFDVTVGSYEGAEICELVGLYIMDKLDEKYGKKESVYAEMTVKLALSIPAVKRRKE